MKTVLTGSFDHFDPQLPATSDPTPRPVASSLPHWLPVLPHPAPPPAGLLACAACPARSEARQVVPGVGPVDARLYFIGQNPGEEEDVVGIPFIGEAGQEFNRWLAILGIDRAKVFVTNVVKCHTYSNRVPRASEISTCSNLWVPEELQALPDVQLVFPLGKPAVGRVLGKSAPPMTPLAVHHFQIRILDRAVSVFPLPHPAFFLRAQHLGPLFRETLLPQIRETLQQEFPAVYDACKRVSG